MSWRICWALAIATLALPYFGAAPWFVASAPADEAVAKDDDPANETVQRARDRARLLHSVYAATLDVMHERYFREEKSIVPARALEDVFSEVARQQKVKARWISVNTRAMSINHEPKSEFEKQAAKELAAGKESYEQIEAGLYQRAAPIPLTGGCLACHTGFFAAQPQPPRYAALVIGVPLQDDK
jgi:hypothetical protein